ncbi:MAG: helix-turn-helix transcriptional regulator [Amphritea sp.]
MTESNEKQTVLPEVPSHWVTLNDEYISRIEDIPRRLVVRKFDYKSGFYSPYHSHGWGQLLFISEGLIQVSAEGIGYWVVPPQRAVWIPAFVEHDARTIHSVLMRNVYISPEAAQGLPNHCQVINVSPLLRELILALVGLDTLYDEDGAAGRLVSVFLDQLKAIPEVPLHLPQPGSKSLQKIAATLRAEPADKRSMDDWAIELGLSSRTLARRFRKETGMTFGQWRQQARLLSAITRIAQGDPVAHIAQDLGYDSQSAFITMFRKALGKTPGRYFDVGDK